MLTLHVMACSTCYQPHADYSAAGPAVQSKARGVPSETHLRAQANEKQGRLKNTPVNQTELNRL